MLSDLPPRKNLRGRTKLRIFRARECVQGSHRSSKMATQYTATTTSPASSNTIRYDGYSSAPAVAQPAVSQSVFQPQNTVSQFDRISQSFATLGAQPAAGQQTLGAALQNKPLDVFGGALLAGSQQMGLRPDANQMMSQVLVQLLSSVLELVVGMMKGQLGQGAQGALPQQAGGLPAFPQAGTGFPAFPQQAGGLPSFPGFPQQQGGIPAFPQQGGFPAIGQGQPAVGQPGFAPAVDAIPVGFAPTGTLPI